MAALQQGPAKLAAVKGLVDKLRDDLKTPSLTTSQRDTALEELKVYGRDPRFADPLFTKEGIETLLQLAFSGGADSTAKNALRVLCNALVLKEQTRQMFIDLGYEGKACERLKNDDPDDEFLCSRLLFLTTYGTSVDLSALIEKHQLADTITKNLERHARLRSSGQVPSNPMVDMAMTESLKLLFNITHFATAHTAAFTSIIPPVVQLLSQMESATSKPLDPPVNFLINALLNLDLGSAEIHDALYPPDEPEGVAKHLINLLTKSTTAYHDAEYDMCLTPLLGVIRAVHEYAPAAVKASIRTQLLPTDKDRAQVLGTTASLSSWLLKNTTNPLAPKTREVIADLLYDMSDRDATTFVDNVGYGFASGYLFNKNIPIPASLTAEGGPQNDDGSGAGPAGSLSSSSQQSNTGNGGGGGGGSSSSRPVNPITGQFLDKERKPEGPEMTVAEKEREAERLFVLFERLRANGVISAENPLRTAVEQGQFEELEDEKKGSNSSDYDEEEEEERKGKGQKKKN
ncbi:guanine nucleotide exchange factor [Microdochium trichocladiopsis]|uniref:Guanine nucleotide exchange factor n=1 Tax=Microdochium trichocladiopsis TaxID=1682393 RepID=A0A9P8Y0U8_9PEZI|nr:guanine nucleotide exchange factor [Microdochium trichocladiopsis]KAH7027778.1 guanine nucleotide exchange factor [Microdochium trichocladiopsis]